MAQERILIYAPEVLKVAHDGFRYNCRVMGYLSRSIPPYMQAGLYTDSVSEVMSWLTHLSYSIGIEKDNRAAGARINPSKEVPHG